MPPRRGHDEKSPRPHIPRPPNAFILFRSSFIRSNHVPGKVEGNHSTLSKIIGLCWKALAPQERRSWEEKARLAQAEHRTLYPDWRWTPEGNALGKKRARKSKKSDGEDGNDSSEPQPKRKTRSKDKGKGRGRESEADDYDEDARVTKIADLVKEGKTGTDLEKALEEWQVTQRRPQKKRRHTTSSSNNTQPSTSSSALHAPPSPSQTHVDSAEDVPEVPRLTTHITHDPSHTPSPTAFYPSLPRPVDPSAVTWPEGSFPSTSSYNQWWTTSTTSSAPNPSNSSSPYGPSFEPPTEITTEGLGYEEDSTFDRDYSESFRQMADPHHNSNEGVTQWTRNPGRNGVCAVISDPLRECDNSPTTSSPTTFPPPALPSVIDNPPSANHQYFAPGNTIASPPAVAVSNAAFIPSTYSSLTGWAGDYGDPGHHADSISSSSPGWFNAGTAWQGPQRSSSSWGQQQIDTLPLRLTTDIPSQHHKILTYIHHSHSTLRLQPLSPPTSSSPTAILHIPDSSSSPTRSHSQ